MTGTAQLILAIGLLLLLGMVAHVLGQRTFLPRVSLLVTSSAFPEYRSVLLPIVIGATVVFEILGPLGTRMALNATKN
jgi:hypothetical protein